MAPAEIKFLGAARQVTGSCYLLRTENLNILIDCGLYQERNFLGRNWDEFPEDPSTIDFILLTHAHLDHSGLIPKIVREGFKGKILSTAATADILDIALMDAAHIQEEDAENKKKRHAQEGRQGPYPVIPLFTTSDVMKALPLVEQANYDQLIKLDDKVSVYFRDAGHILGSAMIEIHLENRGEERRLVFSGDIGQKDKPFLRDPNVFEKADYVVMESTYGDRNHVDPEPIDVLLEKVINATIQAGGNVVIPTFAIERAQDLMFYLNQLIRKGRLKPLPVYLDSPMASAVTEAFKRHVDYFDRESADLMKKGENPFAFPGLKVIQTMDESRALNSQFRPSVIMAGSGMCTGGRIKNHLLHNLPRPESTVLFVGYQAMGTLGREILDGKKVVRVLGKQVPVNASIRIINGFSGHADQNGLIDWLSSFKTSPRRLFVCHGDEEVCQFFAEKIRQEKKWPVDVPSYLEVKHID